MWLVFQYAEAIGNAPKHFVTVYTTQTHKDWELIASAFVNKDHEDCKFELLSMDRSPVPCTNWEEEEDDMLSDIIRYCSSKSGACSVKTNGTISPRNSTNDRMPVTSGSQNSAASDGGTTWTLSCRSKTRDTQRRVDCRGRPKAPRACAGER